MDGNQPAALSTSGIHENQLFSVSNGSANLSAFCIGNMLGWISPMQPLLESSEPPVGDIPLTKEQVSWVGSINFLGALVGSLMWGWMSDHLGRKKTGLLVAVPFTLSWIILLSAKNFYWLIVGRLIVGVGCCGVIINMPVFVTEISEDSIRGRLGSFLMFSLTAGTVFCYIIGSFAGYVGLTATCLSIPILFAIAFSFMPESPVWLFLKNRHEEADKSLSWYRGNDRAIVESELLKLKNRPRPSQQGIWHKISSLWSKGGTSKAMMIGFGFVFGQQLCGILGIVTFAVNILDISGSSVEPYHAAIIIGVLQLLSSIVSTLLVDKAGRRVLLIGSFFIMAGALIILGMYFLYDNKTYSWLPVFCLSFHVIAYSLGAGPVPFIVLSEIFSAEFRGTAISIIQMCGTFFSFISVKIFLTLMKTINPEGCFFFFGACNLLAATFVLFFLPETKGKPLHVILKKLEGNSASNDIEGGK